MRHRIDGRKFNRNTSHRRAMFRNLAGNLVNHERIVTTEAKAKELRRVADRLITKAKRLGEVAYTPHDKLNADQRAKRLHVTRQLESFLPRFGMSKDGSKKHDLVEKVMVELAKRFATRPGGYTRTIKLGPRRGDNAPMTVIEFVDTALEVSAAMEPPAVSPGEASTTDEPKAAAAPKKAKAKAKKSDGDKLTKIEGIGPKIAELLVADGIDTFAKVADTKAERIAEILAAAGSKFKSHDPTTWPEQAKMAAEGDWDALKKWQDEHDGGRA